MLMRRHAAIFFIKRSILASCDCIASIRLCTVLKSAPLLPPPPLPVAYTSNAPLLVTPCVWGILVPPSRFQLGKVSWPSVALGRSVICVAALLRDRRGRFALACRARPCPMLLCRPWLLEVVEGVVWRAWGCCIDGPGWQRTVRPVTGPAYLPACLPACLPRVPACLPRVPACLCKVQVIKLGANMIIIEIIIDLPSMLTTRTPKRTPRRSRPRPGRHAPSQKCVTSANAIALTGTTHERTSVRMVLCKCGAPAVRKEESRTGQDPGL